MSKLPEGERIRRDKMFQQGLLWCSKCKQFHPVKCFRKYDRPDRNTSSNYGYFLHCLQCERAGHFKRRNHTLAKMNSRTAALKAKFVELAGGRCQRCGFNDFLSSLDFHHVYPAEKKHNPTELILGNNFEKTWKELDKCCLLCRNCHGGYQSSSWRAEFIKRDNLLGWTVGDPLPLDDNRYEAAKPTAYKQTPLPPFTYSPQSQQLALFETRPAYR